ncbi:hypothetical protein LTR09_010964 [Extremus antarcticus]|uniref:CorA-like transporter domain-containing protein n=1 Tax=Extremus antarcticus TaxID=702011 RepID=A0AAJ0D6X4_9PEZI|nr:hypothetical protein LTR09_010964 [Extremus antarcticus]
MDGWRLYPEGVDSFNPFECDAAAARQYLIDHEKLIFSESDVSVNIIDASGKQEMSLSLLRDTDSIPDSSRFKADHSSFYKEVDVLRHIKASNPDLRIISILRKHSLSPLMVSRELLLKILTFHDIGPGFLDLLPAFRVVDELSEKGNSLWSVRRGCQGEIGIVDSK